MKLDDSSRGTSPRHFEEENPDVRKREKKNMHGTQTCKTSKKFEKKIQISNQTKVVKTSEQNIHLDFS